MASSRYGSRTEVYVPIGTINYGFYTNMDAGDQSLLGHTVLDRSAPPVKLVLGANAPKPGKASRRTATEFNSSFYNVANSAQLRAAGWRLGFPKLKAGKGSNGLLSSEYYVTIAGVKYAWSLPKEVETRIGAEISSLGLQLTQSSDTDYVFGARYPKPPRASSISVGAGGTQSVSTFFDPSVTLPAGWSQTKSGFTSLVPA